MKKPSAAKRMTKAAPTKAMGKKSPAKRMTKDAPAKSIPPAWEILFFLHTIQTEPTQMSVVDNVFRSTTLQEKELFRLFLTVFLCSTILAHPNQR